MTAEQEYQVSLTARDIDHIVDALNVFHIRINAGVTRLLETSDLIRKISAPLTH